MTATAEPSPIGAPFDDHDPDLAGRPTLPSAADHYAAACGYLADAEAPGTPIAEVHRCIELANARTRAGHLAVAIWPAPETPPHRLPSVEAWAATGAP